MELWFPVRIASAVSRRGPHVANPQPGSPRMLPARRSLRAQGTDRLRRGDAPGFPRTRGELAQTRPQLRVRRADSGLHQREQEEAREMVETAPPAVRRPPAAH